MKRCRWQRIKLTIWVLVFIIVWAMKQSFGQFSSPPSTWNWSDSTTVHDTAEVLRAEMPDSARDVAHDTADVLRTDINKIADDTTNYQTAYGWGDHSTQNYLDNDDASVDTAAWNAANDAKADTAGDGSNIVDLGSPFIIQEGSNIFLTVDNDTLTITGQAGGGGADADSIKGIPIQDTTGNIGNDFGLTFDDSTDTLIWTEFWASPQTTPTDNYVLKVDTDPDPDILYWAQSIIRKTAEIQTTDATQTTLVSHTLLDENIYHTEAYVVAVQSDGTDRASYHIACTVYRTGAGSATLQGSVTSLHTQESNVNLDAIFTVSGNNVRVSVTGIAAETWEWGTTITYINISN